MLSNTTIAVDPVKTGRAETAEAEAEPSGVSETLAETVTLSVPTSATQSEAAAIATAIGAHLSLTVLRPATRQSHPDTATVGSFPDDLVLVASLVR